jgi:hydroxymethylbilane synthase
MKIRIGTRNSKLALYQTNMAVNAINKACPDVKCEIVPILTTGDKITDKNLYDIGGKALFLKEIEQELINGTIDIAVHSLKDVPGLLPSGLKIAAVLERGDPMDVFVSTKYESIESLPIGAIVGTSSPRRKVMLQKKRPDLKFVLFRGNVPTRLEKIKNAEVDASILACSGLKRLDLYDSSYCHIIPVTEIIPAAGQGTIAIETREDDKKIEEICKKINHLTSWHASLVERSFLSYLDASCRTPISAYAEITGNDIVANFMISDFEGELMEFTTEYGVIQEAEEIGIRAAKYLSSLF